MCRNKQLTLYTKLTAGSARAILPPHTTRAEPQARSNIYLEVTDQHELRHEPECAARGAAAPTTRTGLWRRLAQLSSACGACSVCVAFENALQKSRMGIL